MVQVANENHVVLAEFAASEPAQPTNLPPDKFLGAVRVTFDLPWHFCSVAQTVPSPEDIAGELRYLVEVLS